MDYILEVIVPSENARSLELVAGSVFLSSAVGSSVADTDGRTLTTVYFETALDRDRDVYLFQRIAGTEVRPVDVETVDWLERYEQSLRPILIGRKFVVAPRRAIIPQTSRHKIVIPQERAFGTGSHESTALCLEMLEDAELGGKVCADVGTGSGVLAIAMIMLGARRVAALDNDFECLPLLRTNLGRNEVDQASVRPFCGTIESLAARPYDVVTMNILPRVIIPALPAVRQRAADGGKVILSGILIGQKESVIDAATAAGLRLDREKTRGEWWCGEFVIA